MPAFMEVLCQIVRAVVFGAIGVAATALVPTPASADVIFSFTQTGPVTVGNPFGPSPGPSPVPSSIGVAFLTVSDVAFAAGMNVSFDQPGSCQPFCPTLSLPALGITGIQISSPYGVLTQAQFSLGALGNGGWIALILQSAPEGTPTGTIHWSDGTVGVTWTLNGPDSFLRQQPFTPYYLIAQGDTQRVPEPAGLGVMVVGLAALGLFRRKGTLATGSMGLAGLRRRS